MRSPLRIALRGHERRGGHFLLVFSVDDGRGEQAATVLVQPSGPRFPHELGESGLSLGAVADAALRERAEQTCAMLDAAEAWRTMHSGRRDRRCA